MSFLMSVINVALRVKILIAEKEKTEREQTRGRVA